MTQTKSSILRLELFWWLFTIVVIIGTLFPILRIVDNYPFLWPNIIFILVFITLGRHIFLLKHTFIAWNQKLKIVLLFLCIPLAFYLIDQLNYFQVYLDEDRIENLVKHLNLSKRSQMLNYIRSEYIFFGVGSLVCAIIFPFRMLISVWRVRNRGTV